MARDPIFDYIYIFWVVLGVGHPSRRRRCQTTTTIHVIIHEATMAKLPLGLQAPGHQPIPPPPLSSVTYAPHCPPVYQFANKHIYHDTLMLVHFGKQEPKCVPTVYIYRLNMLCNINKQIRTPYNMCAKAGGDVLWVDVGRMFGKTEGKGEISTRPLTVGWDDR